MLKTDLTLSMNKKEYKRIMPGLQNRLYSVQKASWEADIPVVILFEGWEAAGKGISLRKLTAPLDPRGFKLYHIQAPRTHEQEHPWMRRFWLKLPELGEWSIFDRSWYRRILADRVEGLIPESQWRRAYRDILDFERTIAEDGHLIIKFFLHISKREQKQRLEKLAKNPKTAWRVTQEDWARHHNYDDWTRAYEDAFERTDTEWGHWTILQATDRRYTRVKIYKTIIKALEKRLAISKRTAYRAETQAGGQAEQAAVSVEVGAKPSRAQIPSHST